MTNQFDLNKFNSFLDSTTKAISCDSECQKNKTAKSLKNKYFTAKSNLTLAEPQYEMAKKNYYTYISGEDGYNELIEKELKEKAKIFINEFKDNYKNLSNKEQLMITQLSNEQIQPPVQKSTFNGRTNGLRVVSGLRAGAEGSMCDFASKFQNLFQGLTGTTTADTATTTTGAASS